ncbi:hypothetical protein Q4S45_17300 [Massilia sp. R2A-15]|uniref:hypothetical protein n=1 Tax=Massilia sp. R2A-15 TaxID=3064278 RepID=UPI002735BD1B|nr:hypothetical protein [Massilia sp. R2A-15]WLI88469.1 hypothetical protein Q4S45_17300 [Massilia sp. R2A-15]
MTRLRLAGAVLLAIFGAGAQAQQVADLSYRPPLTAPAYREDAGPRIAIDSGHYNFHTADGRYQPFAELLRRDGFRVGGSGAALSAQSLAGIDVLVIANALNQVNQRDWRLPNPAAFTEAEIAALREWVDNGGSLLLIADHMPFAGAATTLARAFGVEFSNGFAGRSETDVGPIDFTLEHGLAHSAVTEGRNASERISHVISFTGSAFKPPAGAIPVMTFAPGYVSLLAKAPFRFDASTRRVPLAGWSQGALLTAGKGRVAVFGEAGMFTAQLAGPQARPFGMNAPDADQNAQFLLNVAHWLARTPGIEP